MSNAVAISKNIGILYSRTTITIYLLSILSIYYSIDWYYFDRYLGIYNGLFYSNVTNLQFIFFFFLLTIYILVLSSFFP